MSSRLFLFLVMSTSFIHYTKSESDWTRQCNRCVCIWVSGRKTANCSSKEFTKIPQDLSNATREIDFSNNPLHSLNDGEFISANLVDIHKLKFQNCLIESLNEGAFRRLALIIELDLSRNMIVELKKNTFRDNIKLRVLILSHNKIRELEDGLFSNMSFIQRIHADHNEISSITENTFYNLPSLTDVSLEHNRIKTVEFDLKLKLPKLNSLNVADNPWVCDCHLEIFHRSVVRNNLITHETKCEEPPRLKGRLWTARDVFPCSPVIVSPLASTQITADSSNITLVCQVMGEPTPDVDWTSNGHIVERELRKNKQKYFTTKDRTGNYTWNNLTIINLSFKDRGEYKCIAKNPGGQDEKNLTLIIDTDLLAGGGFTDLNSSSGLIIGLSVGLIILLIVILILVCLFCRKVNNNALQSKRNDLGGSSQEAIGLSENHEFKKNLITDVNPVSKPPRAPVMTSVVSGGTEVSDVKRNLLDDESVYDFEDEGRSDFDQPLLLKSRNHLPESDYRMVATYPPDLLSFPARSHQISPAGSSASTIIVETRLPPIHGPQSPLHSPIYDQLGPYKTLPHIRSHSPFAPGLGVARIPRQGAGYVTIPRRPRQSWSSEPPPSSEIIGEPLYDNLGIRTTADGASALSLNKLGTESATTPRSARFQPMSPSSAIAPIVESHESAPQPDQSMSSSPQLENKPSPNSRQSQPPPVKAKPVLPQKPVSSQTLPRSLHYNTQASSPSPVTPEPLREHRSSVVSETPSVDKGKPKKIPPRPPPKPTKRSKPISPKFDDEGVDGTEV